MKFLFKIWSGFDGFVPAKIPERLLPRSDLKLGWMRYMDPAEIGDEVWVYFHGSGVRNGIYAKGFIRAKHPKEHYVLLRVQEYATGDPLTDGATNERIAAVVGKYGLQVFIYPEVWDIPPECSVSTSASSCEKRQCRSCRTWQSLPLIRHQDYSLPHRLPSFLETFVPAYWVIPSRCFLYSESKQISPLVHRTSDLFYRFKMGISKLAYPLALGLYEGLQERALLDFDCIVPIPLSPEKVENKEIHRTLLLARELGRLLGVEVADALRLSRPTSKSILRTGLGLTPRQFETKYLDALAVDSCLESYTRILLLDDVCTEGSTLRAAATAITQTASNPQITAAAAGQMIMRAVVRDDSMLFAD